MTIARNITPADERIAMAIPSLEFLAKDIERIQELCPQEAYHIKFTVMSVNDIIDLLENGY